MFGMRVRTVRYYAIPYGLTDKAAWDFEVAHVTDDGLDLLGADSIYGNHLDPQ